MPQRSYRQEKPNVHDSLDGQYEYITQYDDTGLRTPFNAPDPSLVVTHGRAPGISFHESTNGSEESSSRARPYHRDQYRPATPAPSDFFETSKQSRRHEGDKSRERGRDQDQSPDLVADRTPLRGPDRRGPERRSNADYDCDERYHHRGSRRPTAAQQSRLASPSLSASTAAPSTSLRNDHSPALRPSRDHRGYARSPSPPRHRPRHDSPPGPSPSSRRPRDMRDNIRPETRAVTSKEARHPPARTPTRPSITRSKSAKDKSMAWLSNPRLQQAAAAAFQAGAMTAFSTRSEPGKWGGQKGARVATAALGAAAMDAFANSQETTRAASPENGELGSALGGLLIDRMSRKGSRRTKHR